MTSPVKISILMPVYNGEKTIARALESIFNQNIDKDKYEIIIVNDGSTDGTPEILEKYKDLIRIVNQDNKGYLIAAKNSFENSKGKYVIKLDADDEFGSKILSKMYSILEEDLSLAFVYSDYYEKDSETGKTRIINTRENIFNTVAIGVMFRKSILDEIGFYNENLIFPEYDLLIRIMKKYKGKHLNEPLFTYYRSRNSITSNKELVQKGLEQLYEKYGKLPIRGY